MPIPINLDTINRLYGTSFTSFELAEFFKSLAEPREAIRTSEDVIVSQVGRELYEKFFRNYTRKQWGLDPSELDAAVTARVPVRTNRDDRYFTDLYQAMPKHGYTRMFERMLAHPNIKILLNTDYREIEGAILYDDVICTGPDRRILRLPVREAAIPLAGVPARDGRLGASAGSGGNQLPQRSSLHASDRVQASDRTGASEDNRVYEYPKAEGDPYYPIPRAENAALYKQYQELAERTPGVHFVGRLGPIGYYNMDQVVAQALTLYSKSRGYAALNA